MALNLGNHLTNVRYLSVTAAKVRKDGGREKGGREGEEKEK